MKNQVVDPGSQAKAPGRNKPSLGPVSRALSGAPWDVAAALVLGAAITPFFGVAAGRWAYGIVQIWDKGRVHYDIDILGLLVMLTAWLTAFALTFLVIWIVLFLLLRALPPGLRGAARIAAVVLAVVLGLMLFKVVPMPASWGRYMMGQVAMAAPTHGLASRCTMEADWHAGPDA